MSDEEQLATPSFRIRDDPTDTEETIVGTNIDINETDTENEENNVNDANDKPEMNNERNEAETGSDLNSTEKKTSVSNKKKRKKRKKNKDEIDNDTNDDENDSNEMKVGIEIDYSQRISKDDNINLLQVPGMPDLSARKSSRVKAKRKRAPKRKSESKASENSSKQTSRIELSREQINAIQTSAMSAADCGLRLDSNEVNVSNVNKNNVEINEYNGCLDNINGCNDKSNGNNDDSNSNNNDIVLPSCPEANAAAKLFVNKYNDGIHNFLSDKKEDEDLSQITRDTIIMIGVKVNFISSFMNRILKSEVEYFIHV